MKTGQMTTIDTWNGHKEKFLLCPLIILTRFVDVFQCSKKTAEKMLIFSSQNTF